MAQAPSEDSTQYAVLQILENVQAAGTLVHIETAAGEGVLTFVPTKEYQSVVISSPELQNGESYVVYTGGSATGTPKQIDSKRGHCPTIEIQPIVRGK